MPKKPFVHLILPQLFQPLDLWNKGYKFEVKSSYLTKLLQSYYIEQQDSVGINASLFSSVGFSTKEELPVAHYRYQVHCHSTPPKNALLLCADPVHLVVGMSDVTLTDKITDLTAAEANELIDLLNTHFNQDGLMFTIGSNSQWYLSVAETETATETINTTAIENVIRKNIASYPIQSSRHNWQAVQNEIQMLLHSAPLNQQRETAGLPTVNSLWLWGGGVPKACKPTTSLVLSDDMISGEMLAIAAKCTYQHFTTNQQIDSLHALDKNNVPDFNLSMLLSIHPEGNTIIINESLVEAAINDDLDAYQLALDKLEKHLIKPLFELWKANKINMKIDSCDGKLITPIVSPSWKFWKKIPNSLSELDL